MRASLLLRRLQVEQQRRALHSNQNRDEQVSAKLALPRHIQSRAETGRRQCR